MACRHDGGQAEEAGIDGGADDAVTWPSNRVVGVARARARGHRQCGGRASRSRYR
jgi:hypothetical protein